MACTDWHTTSHGALNTFAFGIGATEMASVWSLGVALNIEVPASIKVVVSGKFALQVGPKDLILHLVGLLTAEGANYRAIEFHGDTIRNMSTSGRLVLCNMAVEAGATSGVVPGDEETVRYLRQEAHVTDPLTLVTPDPDAVYERTITIDVAKLAPQIACPHTVDNVKPIEAVAGTKIQQIVIGSCTNGRLDDIAAAARILKGKKVAKGTRMLVFPASGRIFQEAMEQGYVSDLMKAGAVVMNSGCGPCLGVHEGALGDGEVALSTTNRNFKGRMGNPNSEVYLCSPEVAAASALTGVIADPQKGRALPQGDACRGDEFALSESLQTELLRSGEATVRRDGEPEALRAYRPARQRPVVQIGVHAVDVHTRDAEPAAAVWRGGQALLG